MSASSQSSLTSQSISVSANAAASYGLASGSVTASAASSSANSIATSASTGTFTFQLAPAIDIPAPANGWAEAGAALSSSQCSGWVANMQAGNNGAGSYAYPTSSGNTFQVASIASIFTTANAALFPGWTPTQITTVGSLIATYMTSGCPAQAAYGYACVPTTTGCNPGCAAVCAAVCIPSHWRAGGRAAPHCRCSLVLLRSPL